jgi:hypothetical protein
MRDSEEFEFAIPAEHGDLVTVDGYDGRFFMVIGYQLIRNCLPEEEYNEVVYEVLDAVTGEFLEADGEDVEFVTDAEHAVDYLRENPPHEPMEQPKFKIVGPTYDEWKSYFIEGDETMSKSKEPRKPTAREISAKEAEERKAARKALGEEIDNLLDLRNWAADMLAKTNNEEYGDRVMAIDAKLKELVDND